MKKNIILLLMVACMGSLIGCKGDTVSGGDVVQGSVALASRESQGETEQHNIAEEPQVEILQSDFPEVSWENQGETIQNAVINMLEENHVELTYGSSNLFSKADMVEAIEEIWKEFNTWEGCKFYSISYASDEESSPENLEWMNELADANGIREKFDECIVFVSEFQSPKEMRSGFDPHEKYENFHWWLARTEGGSWHLMTYGY